MGLTIFCCCDDPATLYIYAPDTSDLTTPRGPGNNPDRPLIQTEPYFLVPQDVSASVENSLFDGSWSADWPVNSEARDYPGTAVASGEHIWIALPTNNGTGDTATYRIVHVPASGADADLIVLVTLPVSGLDIADAGPVAIRNFIANRRVSSLFQQTGLSNMAFRPALESWSTGLQRGKFIDHLGVDSVVAYSSITSGGLGGGATTYKRHELTSGGSLTTSDVIETFDTFDPHPSAPQTTPPRVSSRSGDQNNGGVATASLIPVTAGGWAIGTWQLDEWQPSVTRFVAEPSGQGAQGSWRASRVGGKRTTRVVAGPYNVLTGQITPTVNISEQIVTMVDDATEVVMPNPNLPPGIGLQDLTPAGTRPDPRAVPNPSITGGFVSDVQKCDAWGPRGSVACEIVGGTNNLASQSNVASHVDYPSGVFYNNQIIHQYYAVGDAGFPTGGGTPAYGQSLSVQSMRDVYTADGLGAVSDANWPPTPGQWIRAANPSDRIGYFVEPSGQHWFQDELIGTWCPVSGAGAIFMWRDVSLRLGSLFSGGADDTLGTSGTLTYVTRTRFEYVGGGTNFSWVTDIERTTGGSITRHAGMKSYNAVMGYGAHIQSASLSSNAGYFAISSTLPGFRSGAANLQAGGSVVEDRYPTQSSEQRLPDSYWTTADEYAVAKQLVS